METNHYFDAYELVRDWKEAQGRELSNSEQVIAEEARAQITAYTGRSYADVRLDIARCAVQNLSALQEPHPTNVTQLPINRQSLYRETVYVPTTTRVSQ